MGVRRRDYAWSDYAPLRVRLDTLTCMQTYTKLLFLRPISFSLLTGISSDVRYVCPRLSRRGPRCVNSLRCPVPDQHPKLPHGPSPHWCHQHCSSKCQLPHGPSPHWCHQHCSSKCQLAHGPPPHWCHQHCSREGLGFV